MADSYVKKNNGAANFGGAAQLHIDPDPNATARTYLRFDLSPIPSTATIQSATLTLCPTQTNAVAVGRIYKATRVTSAWDESAITWNDQPSVAGDETASALVLAGLSCVGYAVGDDVKMWIEEGVANHGWQVGDTSENASGSGMTYGSRENSDSAVRPILTVTWVP